jgi:hypothetical protein
MAFLYSLHNRGIFRKISGKFPKEWVFFPEKRQFSGKFREISENNLVFILFSGKFPKVRKNQEKSGKVRKV